MSYPTIENRTQGRHNQISREIEAAENAILRQQTCIGILDNAQRETWSIAAEVAEAQLNIIGRLIESGKRDFVAANQELDQELAGIKKGYVDSYATVLRERGAYVEDGRIITVRDNESQIGALIQDFDAKITARFNKFRQQIPLNEGANLNQLQSKLQEITRQRTQWYDKVDRYRFEQTDKLYQMDQDLREVLQRKRRALYDNIEFHDIYSASALGNLPYVEIYCQRQKASQLNVLDQYGFAPLHYAAYNNQPSVVRLLVKNGANAYVQDANGACPIHYAAAAGLPHVIHTLCRTAAKISEMLNLQDASGRTPISRATHHQRPETVECLIDLGADPNMPDWRNKDPTQKGTAPLEYAINTRNPAVLAALLKCKKLEVNIRNKKGESMLYGAVCLGNVRCVIILLSDSRLQLESSQMNLNHISNLVEIAQKQKNDDLERILKAPEECKYAYADELEDESFSGRFMELFRKGVSRSRSDSSSDYAYYSDEESSGSSSSGSNRTRKGRPYGGFLAATPSQQNDRRAGYLMRERGSSLNSSPALDEKDKGKSKQSSLNNEAAVEDVFDPIDVIEDPMFPQNLDADRLLAEEIAGAEARDDLQ